jgi:AcrR family transcriptional regulator
MARRYDMSRRTAAVEETKRRIVQATMELHDAQGILDTSWEDIAQRADVAPATVYRHFPTLDELLPACGELSTRRLRLPTPADVEATFAGVRARRERLRRMAELVFGVYERGADMLREVRYVRSRLEPVQRFHEELEGRIDGIVDAALEPLAPPEERGRLVRALVSFGAWEALDAQPGVDPVDATVELLDAWLRRRR